MAEKTPVVSSVVGRVPPVNTDPSTRLEVLKQQLADCKASLRSQNLYICTLEAQVVSLGSSDVDESSRERLQKLCRNLGVAIDVKNLILAKQVGLNLEIVGERTDILQKRLQNRLGNQGNTCSLKVAKEMLAKMVKGGLKIFGSGWVGSWKI